MLATIIAYLELSIKHTFSFACSNHLPLPTALPTAVSYRAYAWEMQHGRLFVCPL